MTQTADISNICAFVSTRFGFNNMLLTNTLKICMQFANAARSHILRFFQTFLNSQYKVASMALWL